MALDTITGIAEPIGAAAVFSVLWFIRSQDSKTSLEDWNWYKFGATILVGIGVGISMAAIGEPLSQEAWGTRMTAYTGTIVFVQGIIQAAWRNLPREIYDLLNIDTPTDDTHDRDPDTQLKLNHTYNHFKGRRQPPDTNDEPLNEHDEYVGDESGKKKT